MPAIIARDLTRTYRTAKRYSGLGGTLRGFFSRAYDTVQAVDQVSFEIAPGELVGLIGQNGAGKSTTFKMLTGVLKPTAGELLVHDLVPWQQRQKLARSIGSVFGQRSQLWWDLPVYDSMDILHTIYAVPKEVMQRNLAAYETTLAMGELWKKPVRQLSLGQRMRSELAAAFLHDPAIAFLDEPLLGLDVVVKEQVRQFIRERNQQQGTTIVLASNDMADVERLCQRVLIIDKGKLLYNGTVEEIKRRFAPFRLLTVHLGEAYAQVQIPDAEVVSHTDNTVTLSFDRDRNPQQLISALSQHYVITDLAITELSLEEIIHSMYTKHLLEV